VQRLLGVPIASRPVSATEGRLSDLRSEKYAVRVDGNPQLLGIEIESD
jgi:hypothetical protein